MTKIIEKRFSLHKELAGKHREIDVLKSQLNALQPVANIGITTCMIAHEINNLLTPIASYASLALNNLQDKPLTEKALRKAMQNCERATRVMESMLAIANGRSQEKKQSNLLALVEEVFNCLCRDFSKDGITVKIQIPEGLTIRAVPVQIQQVLMNLVLNARDAMLPGGGVLTVKAADGNDVVVIDVSDSGCGIKPADLGEIFEPFFTTKKDEKSPGQHSGAGLGLAFCRRIIDEHSGTISVESEPDKGSKFTITLPKL